MFTPRRSARARRSEHFVIRSSAENTPNTAIPAQSVSPKKPLVFTSNVSTPLLASRKGTEVAGTPRSEAPRSSFVAPSGSAKQTYFAKTTTFKVSLFSQLPLEISSFLKQKGFGLIRVKEEAYYVDALIDDIQGCIDYRSGIAVVTTLDSCTVWYARKVSRVSILHYSPLGRNSQVHSNYCETCLVQDHKKLS